jgi:hypothetical protein
MLSTRTATQQQRQHNVVSRKLITEYGSAPLCCVWSQSMAVEVFSEQPKFPKMNTVWKRWEQCLVDEQFGFGGGIAAQQVKPCWLYIWKYYIYIHIHNKMDVGTCCNVVKAFYCLNHTIPFWLEPTSRNKVTRPKLQNLLTLQHYKTWTSSKFSAWPMSV